MAMIKIWLGGFGLLILLTGCLSHVQTIPKGNGGSPFPKFPDQDNRIVGIALSGGGSRAAFFGMSALKALAKLRAEPDKPSLIEQIDYISSVSGGSVAASYFAMKKKDQGVPVLSASGEFTDGYKTFFDEYRKAMSHNYQKSFEWRQFYKVRWFNPAQRAKSLAEVLDELYLSKQGGEGVDSFTLGDLYEREKGGHSPRLILNATLYNNGRRFVITTLPKEDFENDILSKIGCPEVDPNQLCPAYLEDAVNRFDPMTFEEIEADPRGLPISYGVAASASFPPIIGPITVCVGGVDENEKCKGKRYWHAGDGGLVDNQGLESLLQAVAKELERAKQSGNPKRALVLLFDSGLPFNAGEDQLDGSEKGFEVFINDPARIVGIMEQRAFMYQRLFWHIARANLPPGQLVPSEDQLKLIVMRHTDASIEMEELPTSCQDEGFTSKKMIEKYIASIPTLFKIRSKCDEDLLELAAKKVVYDKRGDIIDFLKN